MILGIGIDIVDKDRIEKVITRQGDRFLLRILTPAEYQAMPEGNRMVEYVAGRFAVKEAFAKATGQGIGAELSWQDIEIERAPTGKPTLKVSEKWLKENDEELSLTFHVSITHEKRLAVAQVIIERLSA